jgi:hypothetical protein
MAIESKPGDEISQAVPPTVLSAEEGGRIAGRDQAPLGGRGERVNRSSCRNSDTMRTVWNICEFFDG